MGPLLHIIVERTGEILNKSRMQFSSSLHESVREEILKRINTGTYVPEVPIPSTAMLVEEFGVSPITIKRALRDLQAAGALIAVAGKGTYVKKQRRFLRQVDLRSSYKEKAKVQAISITREKISDPTMDVLHPPKKVMLCVRKVVLADDLPFMYDTTYLSSDVSHDIIDEFGERFVVDALERHQIRVVKTQLVIDAAPASGEAEQVFGITNGYPMLRRLYKMETTDPAITVFGVVQSPFDQLACTIEFSSNP